MTTTARTTRPVTFHYKGDLTNRTLVTDIRTFPAGTEVYVSRTSDIRLRVRVCGTLFEQIVLPGSITEDVVATVVEFRGGRTTVEVARWTATEHALLAAEGNVCPDCAAQYVRRQLSMTRIHGANCTAITEGGAR